MRVYAVQILVDAWAAPRSGAQRLDDGRWSFIETILTTTAEQAVEYFKHYRTTLIAPLTLELTVIAEKENRDYAEWVQVADGPRYTSGIADSPYAAALTRFAEPGGKAA